MGCACTAQMPISASKGAEYPAPLAVLISTLGFATLQQVYALEEKL